MQTQTKKTRSFGRPQTEAPGAVWDNVQDAGSENKQDDAQARHERQDCYSSVCCRAEDAVVRLSLCCWLAFSRRCSSMAVRC